MKYALIGCGRIAVKHLQAAMDNKLDIVALCDINAEQTASLLKTTCFPESVLQYTDYWKMLSEHPEIELVAIATDSGHHARIALDCIEKGVNVIIEKPMALSLTDANEIIQKSRAANVKVTVCHQNRFNLAAAKTKAALLENRLGKLSHGSVCVRWNRNEEYYRQADWRGKWETDGGCLFNQCIHGIDLFCWLIHDEVTEVYGTTAKRFHNCMEAEDLGMALMKFRNGCCATLEGTVNIYPQNLEETVYLFGEKGTVKLGGPSTNRIEIWNLKEEPQNRGYTADACEEITDVYGNGHTRLYLDMIEAIETGKDPLITPEEARKAVEIILAIYQSSRDGKAVALPLKSGCSADYKGMLD